jgi:CO/xanthine dehydrogenase Mo-binding subunit
MGEQPLQIVGRRRARLDGVGKVTGKSIYAADFALPGMLFGRLYRSTVPHARIRRIETTLARAIPGVRAVLTAADIPAVRYGPAVKDMTALAAERVRYVGEPIVAVAATTLEIADAALAAIAVEYEPLPALFDVGAALAADAALLHPEWRDYRALPMLIREGNISTIARMRGGDVERGFAESFRVYEHRFTTQIQHAGYTEPRVAVADWEARDRVVVWTNAQLPFDIQNVLAEVLAISPSSVRIVVPGIGGGFGGKLRIGLEHYAALLARETGRPVKMMSTAEEELTAAHPRQPAVITIKSGVTRDGRILAKQGRVVVDTGAFAGSGPGVAAVATQILAGPYVVPNILLEGIAVYTNKVPTGSFRAPSGPMANFAVESQLDIIADDLGIDPLELRLRNIMREGDRGPAGEIIKAVSIEECLLKAAQAIGWDERRPARNRGKGIACSWWMTTGGSSGVYVRIDPQGTATLVSGAVELGTGALTGAAQILAEELALDLDDIRVGPVDTQASPYDYGAQGSRTAFSVGNACRAAAADLRNQIFGLAARHLGVPARGMELRDKAVIAGNRSMTIAEIARLAQLSGGGLIAHGTAISPPPAYDQARVEGHPLPVWNTPSFHAHAADVSVDPDTGEIAINRYVVAQDVGFAINPTYIEGQIQGGVAQGLGQALSEEIVIEEGRVLNPNLTDYKMPTALDVPPVECILVECASEAGPYGAKGVGEPPCIEPPAAIANAVSAAVGARIQSLPITAEKIALALGGNGR